MDNIYMYVALIPNGTADWKVFRIPKFYSKVKHYIFLSLSQKEDCFGKLGEVGHPP